MVDNSVIKVRYLPEVYLNESLEQAKAAILTPTKDMSIDERWKVETRWLSEHIKFDNDSDLVIDYGCGVGRVAKEIRNPVLGVDISPTMRAHAYTYVDNINFCAISPQMLKQLFECGLRVNGAFSIWALQHVCSIKETIDLLMQVINPRGLFWLMDLYTRRVPVIDGSDGSFIWYDDGVDITSIIEKWCNLESIDLMSIYKDQEPSELRKYRRRL